MALTGLVEFASPERLTFASQQHNGTERSTEEPARNRRVRQTPTSAVNTNTLASGTVRHRSDRLSFEPRFDVVEVAVDTSAAVGAGSEALSVA
ncbi:hypothetical protein ZHAS_00017412 [Anopheles sinensis]|uniref:Uncharacterized protein n=1 Tax=Anopheles sinensis TaxID=74873 RepID=A0A084WGF3_ANOSI|nr:hypothetical protein ZHAS_00017412 [Anopheles sinensis]